MTSQLRDLKRASWTVVVASLIAGTSLGCGASAPAAPSGGGTPTPQPIQLVVFTDPMSPTVTTSNVRDVDGQIVRFDLASGSLIWAADNRMFTGYPVSGYFIRSDHAFQVRFGMEAGERRAYFTETGSATICDIAVVNGALIVSPTNVPVPGVG